MIVIDASVATKWYLSESDSEKALEILKSAEVLIAPDVIRPEVASAITRAVRIGRIPATQARDATQTWLRHLKSELVVLEPSADYIEAAVDLALALEHGLMDCLYLAIAMKQASPLLTADATFARRSATAYSDVRSL